MSLVNRVTNIALRPKEEWPVIAAETATVGSLYSGFIVPLATIAPICTFINLLIFGQHIPILNVTYRPAIGLLLTSLIVGYILTLIGVWVTALIVEKLAPNFQSSGDLTQALKLVTYSQAPVWVAGVLNLIPYLGILTIFVGLYGLYLAYLGLTPVMKTPPEKVVPYLIVVILVSIVVWVAIGLVTSAIIGMGHIAGSTITG